MSDARSIPAPLSHLLGFNAGYVDTAGFLALGGLFTAHVTGNFVTLGAALIHGSAGALSKLLALPVFCVAVLLTRLASNALVARQKAPMFSLVVAQVLLLALAAALMQVWGPFEDGDMAPAFAAGMLMVCAMAVQNAMQRMHLPQLPPSTLMTGNTTQVMIDLADLLKGLGGDERSAAMGRLRKMLPAIVSFAVGCALAALAYVTLGMWCFALPPLVAALTLRYSSV
ncbi:YoaK family protein [Comamonas guangdongensis]|uniref:YoaK family protein n=1 Tax=Comamonas guangdongensis TaxID=510515 RepID=A0ABV3ZYV8_9BURK